MVGGEDLASGERPVILLLKKTNPPLRLLLEKKILRRKAICMYSTKYFQFDAHLCPHFQSVYIQAT